MPEVKICLIGLKMFFSEFGLRKTSLLQLSMDGPSVNWKVYNQLNSELKDNFNAGLLHVGSCGLHTVHNAFKSGYSATKWRIDCFMSSAYYLFKESPARREDYTKVTSSHKFPLKFCCHRWLENESVAKTCIELLPSLELFVKAALEKKVSLPDNKSFETVKKEVMHTPLLACQLSFFASVAKDIEPFLKKYQADEPLLPYMCDDLQKMIRNLMKRFMAPEVLSECSTAKQLMDIGVDNASNYCSLAAVDLGFKTKHLLQQAQKKTSVSEGSVNNFKLECRNFLIATVKQLLEKCPLKFSIIRNISCLDPRNMMDHKDSSKAKMKRLLPSLIEVNRLDHDTADEVLKEYQDLQDTTSASDFDSSQRIDKWFYHTIADKSEYKNLWRVVQVLLTLSHGQAGVERGFSHNKELISDNLSQLSLKARRVVHDHIKIAGGSCQVHITKKLLVSAANACGRYNR